MSNLDDVIKDILGNMFYDKSKTISEQKLLESEFRGSFEYEKPSKYTKTDPKMNRWVLFTQEKPRASEYQGQNSIPITYRGIQPDLDIFVDSSNVDKIVVDEFQNINAPFDKKQAEKLFGPWCKTLSTGNMFGTSGLDYYFDTSSDVFEPCTSTQVFYHRMSPNDPNTVDSKFGLKNLTQMYYQKKFEFDHLKIRPEKDNTKIENFFSKKKIEKTQENKAKKNLNELKDYANEDLKNKIKNNPRYEPVKGWGIYKKNWDCWGGDCTYVGQLVKLPISRVTGKPIYQIFKNKEGKTEPCQPISYEYCLEISWSMINGNSQPNGLKKFTVYSSDDEKKVNPQKYIACTTTKFLKTYDSKDTRNPYPWTTRYDGYCFAQDGISCENVTFDLESGKRTITTEPCHTTISEIPSLDSLDLRNQKPINIPGNPIPLTSLPYEVSLLNNFGTQGCNHCSEILFNHRLSSCGYYAEDCRKLESEKCFEECENSTDKNNLPSNVKIKNPIVFGRI